MTATGASASKVGVGAVVAVGTRVLVGDGELVGEARTVDVGAIVGDSTVVLGVAPAACEELSGSVSRLITSVRGVRVGAPAAGTAGGIEQETQNPRMDSRPQKTLPAIVADGRGRCQPLASAAEMCQRTLIATTVMG